MQAIYCILDTGTIGSIVHNVVSIDISDPNNISYTSVGTIQGFPDKYFINAVLNPILGKLFFALSDSSSNTSVNDIYLYSVTFPDLLTIAPFCVNNTVYINLNPQVTYNVANNLFYYAINLDPMGYDYKVNTIDSNGNINVTNINTSTIQNSGNGLQIFGNYIYAPLRPGNSFDVYYAGIGINTAGSITSLITPQPPGQIWSAFDLNGDLWGVTQTDASSPPSCALYRLQCTTGGLPASNPFLSEHVGDMPITFNSESIVNMALFTPTACIHGSSKILLADCTLKRISKMTQSDTIQCPDGKHAKIKQIIPCWNAMPGQPSQCMIVFERDSICHNQPNERFAIDPKHPMCTIDDYLKDGQKALKCAIQYVNGDTIYSSSIDLIHNKGILDQDIRYDLILEDSDVYVANNLVIKTRFSFKKTGY